MVPQPSLENTTQGKSDMASKKSTSKKRTVTILGIECHIETDVINDYRVLSAMAADDPMVKLNGFDRMLRGMLGDDYNRVLDELQGDDAYLSSERIGEFSEALYKEINEAKN